MALRRFVAPFILPALLLAACGTSGGTLPTVSVSASPTSLTYPGPVTLTAQVGGAQNIRGVLFYKGETVVGADDTAPYTATVPLGYADNGTVTFRARAITTTDSEASATTTVKVNIADANEPNNATGSASLLSIGGSLTGTVGGINRDEDFYKFTAVAGDRLKLTVLSTSYDPKSTLDPYVTVYRPDGKGVLIQDDDGGNGLESELRLNILESGTYYVRVSSYDVILDPEATDNLATNTYQINLTRR